MTNFYNNLSNQRQRFIEVFNDTEKLIASNITLMEATVKSSELTKVYDNGVFKENIVLPQELRLIDNITVTNHRTFEAARLLKKEFPDNKVAVLNFASATNPGGGVTRGSSAQEECLCRASNLYNQLILSKPTSLFYRPNINAKNPLHDDKIIYTPDIVVFKTDDKNYDLLPEEDWYKVDVITCAAPNLREKPSNQFNQGDGDIAANISKDYLYTIHLSRAQAIVRSAIENGVQVLVLGAFGCGAFKNDPKVVAKAYYDVLNIYQQFFNRIEFAIYCNSYEDENFKAFKEQFTEERN